ncbi:hypothetical protein BY458DRAFT_496218 [Sporodiniella umbellata]|nr:hypothetical protein BY458DRAFT_496218 [Sporodiniella umbellata]
MRLVKTAAYNYIRLLKLGSNFTCNQIFYYCNKLFLRKQMSFCLFYVKRNQVI